jgi:hypothetical protein
MTRSATIGFDRRVRTDWLDAVATRHASGAAPAELRRFAHRMLRSEYPGEDARGKTLTVIFHLWVDVPEHAVELRNAAAHLLRDLDATERVALHWGLGVATYPFFRDVADAAGRLLALQDTVSLAQLQRRLAERWGQRSTATRAARRIVRSWIDWGVLVETNVRGIYAAARPVSVSGAVAAWIVEALLVGNHAESQAVAKIRTTPLLFPLDLRISAHELRRAQRLAVHRQGVDEDFVTLAKTLTSAQRNGGRRQRQLTLFGKR